MRITTQGDYALRCLLAIARRSAKGPVAISRIAEEDGLPLDYIEQLLMKMRRKKLIKSVRGVKGGYLLSKDPGSITIKEVLEAVEGEAFEVICDRHQQLKSKRCKASDCCKLKSIWLGLKKEIEGYLVKKTIGALIK
ncbi:MAG: Rrf2 family transcriptional regulator [Candidatus Omnitrophica bacterium]|nr:Rrf2 family transcriptional regulator [Candidatus Omnitrophota bacterium]